MKKKIACLRANRVTIRQVNIITPTGPTGPTGPAASETAHNGAQSGDRAISHNGPMIRISDGADAEKAHRALIDNIDGFTRR